MLYIASFGSMPSRLSNDVPRGSVTEGELPEIAVHLQADRKIHGGGRARGVEQPHRQVLPYVAGIHIFGVKGYAAASLIAVFQEEL